MKVIGIAGKMGTGKTTLATDLQRILPGSWYKTAFADLLKREVSEKFDLKLWDCYHAKRKRVLIPGRGFMEIRSVLQWWGTEIRRNEDPGYWTNAMEKEISHAWATDMDGVVVDDVRFENEAQLVKDSNGTLIRLEPYPGWGCDQEAAQHASETALDLYQDWDLRYHPIYGSIGDNGLGATAQMVKQFVTQAWGWLVDEEVCNGRGRG